MWLFAGDRLVLAQVLLQLAQLLGVCVAGGVVFGDGAGDGRERNSRGGFISSAGRSRGWQSCRDCVVQPDKASRDRASAVGSFGDIDGHLFDDGLAALLDDLNAVDVLGDDAIAHRAQLSALLEGLAQLLVLKGLRLGLLVACASSPAQEVDQPGNDQQAREGGDSRLHRRTR